MRRRAWLIGPISICGLAWAAAFGQSVDDQAVYFRLLAKYQHGDETIDFDVVAGCGVRVTRYGDGDRSYDATRDPVIFAKRTQDGGAIWQIMPGACGKETSENGLVPKDFLPGAVWFDRAEDFSLGIAYVTEDAFENPGSKLKFLGASIQRATREEWEAFQSIATTNLLDPRPFTWGNPKPTDTKEILANRWNRKWIAKWRPKLSCYMMERYRITEPVAQNVLRTYWPQDHPRFWMPQPDEYRAINEAIKRATFNGLPRSRLFQFGHYQSRGFPTRRGGGMLGSDKPGFLLPPEIYPLRSDDGIPWLDPQLESAPTIYRDLDMNDGRSRGFAYCYSSFRVQDQLTAIHVPDYLKRKFATRVDGEQVIGEDSQYHVPTVSPGHFYERTEYLYVYDEFSFY